MANLKDTNYLSIPDNASENKINGVMLAFNITLNTLGVDKHTGRRVLEIIKAKSEECPDSETRDGMMMVYYYLENQIGGK